MLDEAPQTPLIAIGTQVVTRIVTLNKSGKIAHPAGAVGVIVSWLDDRRYRVRFLDGYEENFAEVDLAVRKHFQWEGMKDAAAHQPADYSPYIIYRCIVGSRAYGLDHDSSDTDRRGIYLPPADLHWSLYGIPEQIENQETQECYWELQKFIALGLKANPNVLECLYTPLIEFATPLIEELLAQRSIFLSRLTYQTYNGYVMSQFRKLNADLENYGQIRWKHAMHLIRLLLSGITILREGFVPVRVDEFREKLLTIRQGEMSWEAVNVWRLSLHKTFDAAFAETHLPPHPDYEAANVFLLKARRLMV